MSRPAFANCFFLKFLPWRRLHIMNETFCLTCIIKDKVLYNIALHCVVLYFGNISCFSFGGNFFRRYPLFGVSCLKQWNARLRSIFTTLESRINFSCFEIKDRRKKCQLWATKTRAACTGMTNWRRFSKKSLKTFACSRWISLSAHLSKQKLYKWTG